MAPNKLICRAVILLLCLVNILPLKASAENPLGQTLQINTHFDSLKGNPTWLLMLRNVETGEVLPYLYEIKNYDNFWMALSFGRSYRIISSKLQFESSQSIANFCHLEDGIISGKSYVIYLSGSLRPGGRDYVCHTAKFKNYDFAF